MPALLALYAASYGPWPTAEPDEMTSR
jgi:hypothetical protein